MTAAMIHLWSFPDHFLPWWGYGVFFLAAALAQGLYAGALLRAPSKPLYLAGIWINLALVALYVAARTPGRYTPCKRWTCPVWPPNWP